MGDLFSNIDVIKALGYGLSGLSLLLMILAYGLLRKLINMKNPNKGILSLVKFYIAATLATILIVGIFSIPVFNNNSDLTNQKNAMAISAKINNEFQTIKNSSDPAEAQRHITNITKLSDSLSAILPKIDPQLKTDTSKLNIEFRNIGKKMNPDINLPSKPEIDIAKLKDNAAGVQEKLNNSIFKSLNARVLKR